MPVIILYAWPQVGDAFLCPKFGDPEWPVWRNGSHNRVLAYEFGSEVEAKDFLVRHKFELDPLKVTFEPVEPEGSKITQHGARFREALAIVDPGACNASGIALSIAAACREIREHEPETAATDLICQDAAIRLMAYQLGSLILGLQVDALLYREDVAHCRRRLQELGLKAFGER
jgi:hypothetical protein